MQKFGAQPMTDLEVESIFVTAAKARVASQKGGKWEKKKGLLLYPQFLYATALVCTRLLELHEIPSVLGAQGHIDWGQQFRVLVKTHVLPHVDPNSMPDRITEEFANPKVVSLLMRKLWPLKVVFNQYTTPIALSRHGTAADKCAYANSGLAGGECEASEENAIKGDDGRSMSLRQLLAFFTDFELLPEEKPREVTYSMSTSALNGSERKASVGGYNSRKKTKGAVVNQDSILAVFEKVNAGVGGDEQLDRLCFAEFVEVLARCSVLYFPLADPAAQQRIAAGCIGAFKAGRMPLRTRSERAANRYWVSRGTDRRESRSMLEQSLTNMEGGIRVRDPNAARMKMKLDEEERVRQQKKRHDIRRLSRERKEEEAMLAKYAEEHGGEPPTVEAFEQWHHEHDHDESGVESSEEESSSDEDDFDHGDDEDVRIRAMRSIFDEEETERLHRQIEIMQLRWAAEQVEMASMTGQHLGDLDALMGSLKQQGMEFTNEENIRKVFASSSNVTISDNSSSSSSGSNAVNKANTAMSSSGAVHVYQEQPVTFSFPSIGNGAENHAAVQPEEDEPWEEDEYADDEYEEQPQSSHAMNPSASMPAMPSNMSSSLSLPAIGAATIGGGGSGKERRARAKQAMRMSQSTATMSSRNFFHELGSGLIDEQL